VILAGKRGSLRHSTTSFSENVVVAERSYQMFLRSGERVTSFTKGDSAYFSGEGKYNEEFRGVYFLTIHEKT